MEKILLLDGCIFPLSHFLPWTGKKCRNIVSKGGSHKIKYQAPLQDIHELCRIQEPVLKTFKVVPNSFLTLLKEQVRSDIRRLKNQLLQPSVLLDSKDPLYRGFRPTFIVKAPLPWNFSLCTQEVCNNNCWAHLKALISPERGGRERWGLRNPSGAQSDSSI